MPLCDLKRETLSLSCLPSPSSSFPPESRVPPFPPSLSPSLPQSLPFTPSLRSLCPFLTSFRPNVPTSVPPSGSRRVRQAPRQRILAAAEDPSRERAEATRPHCGRFREQDGALENVSACHRRDGLLAAAAAYFDVSTVTSHWQLRVCRGILTHRLDYDPGKVWCRAAHVAIFT